MYDDNFEQMDTALACDHQCSGNCRRGGCNCNCGEWHEVARTLKVQHLPSDYPSDEATMAEIADQEQTWGEERVPQE